MMLPLLLLTAAVAPSGHAVPQSCGRLMEELRQLEGYTDDAVRVAVFEGFEDSFFRELGVERELKDYILRRTRFYFLGYGESSAFGYYENLGDRSRILVTVSHGERDRQVRILIHELGHAFGMGEAMATLFEERLMGVPYSQNCSAILEVWELYGARGRTTNIVAISQGYLAYDTNFERVLENMLAREGRANQLWDAGMGVYGPGGIATLWNSQPLLRGIISRSELQLIRGVSEAVRLCNSQSHYVFKEQIGMSLQEYHLRFAYYFRILTGGYHPEFAIRGGVYASHAERAVALENFRILTEAVLNLSREFGVSAELDILN